MLRDRERKLLERLGSAGQATELWSSGIQAAHELERADLVFLVPNSIVRAVITPRGRRLLAEVEQPERVTSRGSILPLWHRCLEQRQGPDRYQRIGHLGSGHNSRIRAPSLPINRVSICTPVSKSSRSQLGGAFC